MSGVNPVFGHEIQLRFSSALCQNEPSRGTHMAWTTKSIEDDFHRNMRAMNRNRKHSRAVQMDREIFELEMHYQSNIDGFTKADMEARKTAREQARQEIFQLEADRRNEEEAKPIVGAFLQIGRVCINFGGEHLTWKVTKNCLFCGRIISICHWHHSNLTAGWIRAKQRSGPTPDVEAMPELPAE